jgi:MFS family permease
VSDQPTIRSLTSTVYLPSLLFAIGQGAVLPVVALTAVSLGASTALAGVIVALQGIGRMVFNIPAGRLVDGLGERRAMAIGTAILVGALVGCVLSPSPLWFAGCMVAMGCGWSMWLLARLTYVSDVVPFHLRGRALATLGGVQRGGNVLGPLLGAAVIAAVGLDGAYLVHLVLAVAGLAVLAAVPDPHVDGRPAPASRPALGVAREHLRVLATAGTGAACLGALRAARHAVLPLWGASIGLDATAISLVFGITAAMDVALFYPAGAASDRFGRKAVAVPCLAVLASGFLLLPLTGSFAAVAVVGVVMGFGNGLGSGIVMTLGADFAPTQARAAFLGLWRTVSDIGAAAGPILVAGVAGVATLGAGSVAVGLLGVGGAIVFGRTLPARGEPVRVDPAGTRGVGPSAPP